MVWLPIAKARISPRQVQRDFKKWVKESGIESNLSPHALRHTVGTRLLKEFKNAKLVQRYLGHSDVATTLRYYVDVALAIGSQTMAFWPLALFLETNR